MAATAPHGFLCFLVLSSGGEVELVRVSCSLEDWLPGSLRWEKFLRGKEEDGFHGLGVDKGFF